YAKDLLADPWIKFIDRTFVVWVLAGLAFSFGLGVALTGTVDGGLTGLLWGGAARIFLVHHSTFSINSVCHFFGRQDFDTRGESPGGRLSPRRSCRSPGLNRSGVSWRRRSPSGHSACASGTAARWSPPRRPFPRSGSAHRGPWPMCSGPRASLASAERMSQAFLRSTTS